MINRVLTALVLVTLCASSGFPLSDEYDHDYKVPGELYIDLGYSLGETSDVGYLNFSILVESENKKWGLVAPFVPISIVKRESDGYRYGFTAPAQIVYFGLGWGMSQLIYPNRTFKLLEEFTFIHYLMYAPSGKVQYRFSDKGHFFLSNMTNIMPLKLSGFDRGVLFTPSVGIGFKSERKWGNALGISLAVTYNYFWNFDGESTGDGFGVMLNVFGIGTGH